MHETAMSAALKKAGISGNPRYILAIRLLQQCDGNLEVAIQTLRQVMQDMANGQTGGQPLCDTQGKPAPASDGKGHQRCDTQTSAAQPSETSEQRAGQRRFVPQHENARPAPMQRPRRTPAAHAAATKAVEQAIWDRKLGLFEITLRSATRLDFVNLSRKGLMMGHIADRMLTEIKWPDDTTPLPKVATEAEVKKILDTGYAVLDSLGVTKRPEVAHAR